MSVLHACLYPDCNEFRPANHLTCRAHWNRATPAQQLLLRALARRQAPPDLAGAVRRIFHPESP